MTETIAPWLLSAKVSPPRQLVNACRRKLLLKKLLGSDTNLVTLLEAPAGFGKTLLLSQWREELKKNACIVAWLSMDESDEADILIPYIAYAFQKAGLDMGGTGLLSPSFHGVRTAYSLGRLLNCVENSGKQCILMLDDAERISEDILSEVFEPLLRLQSDNLQLVIACRQNPGIPLSNLSVQGGLTLLGPHEMRFNVDEIGELFGRTLEKKDVEIISQRTNGWPAAIQLLKSFIGDSDTLANVLTTFTGSSREAADYFREQLLKSLSAEAHDFLRETSILDPISIDCANAIRNRDDSQVLVQQLHYLEGIFAPLEGEEETYRLHPLVREYLRESLKENDNETYRRLCRATASWLADKEQSLEAMRYALQADDVNLAGVVFEQMRGGPQLWLQEGMSRLRTGLELLDERDIDSFPRIHLARSLAHSKDGQMKEARAAFERASELSNGFTRDREGGNDTLLLIDRYIIELLLTEYGCSPPTDVHKTDALRFIEDNVESNTAIHGYIMTLNCLLSMQSGSFEDCRRYGDAAIEYFRQCGSRYAELFIYFHFGMSELVRCNSDDALNQYEKANRMVRAEFPGDTGLKRICDVVLGELHWQRGDIGQTKKYLKHIMSDFHHLEAWFDIYMAGYQTIAECILIESGLDASLMFIDKAKQHAQAQELERLEIFLDAINASILYFSGQIDSRLDYKSDIQDLLSDPRVQTTWREIEALSLAHSRVALSHNDFDIAASKVDHLIAIADETGNFRLMVNGLIQRAIIEEHRGSYNEAHDTLNKAIEIAKDGYYIRPFLQEGISILHLLEKIRDCSDGDEVAREFATEVIELYKDANLGEQPVSAFSEREMEILSELSKGQSDKLIARSLRLTPHGVRYHLKNIYAKMGVRNRVQAIAKASDLGIIA